MDMQATAESNLEALRSNRYPGRGIIIGQSPDAHHIVQVYWIMGRSENSRNRIFVQEDDCVRTAPFDESKVEDPSLIIYNCVRTLDDAHIVTNGDQTDTVYEGLQSGRSFSESLYTRTFEPDAPNFTPRISGIVDFSDAHHAYQLGVLKSIQNTDDYAARHIFSYGAFIPGCGHYVATYDGDGSPLPSFSGEPQLFPLHNEINETLDLYWEALDADNKVSLLVKFIDLDTRESAIKIVNKNG